MTIKRLCGCSFSYAGGKRGDRFRVPVLAVFVLLAVLLMPPAGPAQSDLSAEDAAADILVQRLKELARPLFEDVPCFCYRVQAALQIPLEVSEPRVEGLASESLPVCLTLFRQANQEWGLALTSPWRNFAINWTASRSAIILPAAHVSFVGSGELPENADSIAPEGFINRFITHETSLNSFMALMNSASFDYAVRNLLVPQLKLLPARPERPDEILYQLSAAMRLSFTATGTPRICIEAEEGLHDVNRLKYFEISFEPAAGPSIPASWSSDPSCVETQVSRADLEKMVFRGLKRILSIKMPGFYRTLEPQKLANSELRSHYGQTLVLLSGTPEQIGNAHGLLLRPWVRLLVDSTVYLVGLVETVKKARWFINDLDDAWNRLSPHIPERYHREMEAIASACPDVSLREVRLSNVFPEYFHCSGFALFGSATADKALYHGRVLDYMTEIGLQDCAVAFVIRPDSGHAFFNPGFAGFVGAVGGMNESQISIGEMGGRGRFRWDGVPMSFMVRRALEECDTLQQMKDLWNNSLRTCEYFYVFADAKIPDALAVYATPDEMVFLGAGQDHDFLGEGIVDAVVMSAGNRLRHLRRRVQDGHGTFVASSALRLMDRPVAMRSNLHNILFVPILQDAYVAIATADGPAAEKPYVRYNLSELLSTMP
ncbi:MAG: hypothetical protein A2W80_19335 [Candidatus Riflebacteria bacterium GWC2_50_8]|nr:MAG: hypothetical protein A2W80_19335 [Candidatus Riflebacteria bacterium GWC2_50_8]